MDKKEVKKAKKAFKAQGGELFYLKEQGMSVAIMPDSEYRRKNAPYHMYRVAIANCHPGDKFKKSIGGMYAMENMESNFYILLPGYNPAAVMDRLFFEGLNC